MRNRPEPSRRRGLLRATLTVIVLTAIFLAVLAVLSSMTAPAVKAPTVPSTPGHLQTPAVLPTPIKTAAVRTPAASRTPTGPKPHPSSTAVKKLGLGKATTRQSSGDLGILPRRLRHEVLSAGLAPQDTISPNGEEIAYFTGPANQTSGHLWVRKLSGGAARSIGLADRFSQPVWSSDSGRLLFLRVASSPVRPQPWWTLYEVAPGARPKRVTGPIQALNVQPLGWRHGVALLLVSTPSGTALDSVAGGRIHFLDLLVSQSVLDARLAPGGRFVAFEVPTGCSYCTLDVYDISRQSIWTGPSGFGRESGLLWSASGTTLVADYGQRLLTVDPMNASVRWFARPAGLPAIDSAGWTVHTSGRDLELLDGASRMIFRASPTAGP